MADPRRLETIDIPVAEIDMGKRVRPVTEAGVATLIESVETLGMITAAVDVRRKGDRYLLIAGGHRLEAARRLGHETILAQVWACNADWALLLECDENLARPDLSPIELVVFASVKKAAHLKLYPETARGTAGASGRWDATEMSSVASFADMLAEKRGISPRHARNLVRIGDGLSNEAREAIFRCPRHVPLADLDELSQIEGPQQPLCARVMARAESRVRVREALRRVQGAPKARDADPAEAALAALKDRFARAPQSVRREFIVYVATTHPELFKDEG